MGKKEKDAISFRISREKIALLDEAISKDSDNKSRSSVIKDLVDDYIDTMLNQGKAKKKKEEPVDVADVPNLMSLSIEELDDMIAKAEKIKELYEKIKQIEELTKSIDKDKRIAQKIIEQTEDKLEECPSNKN